MPYWAMPLPGLMRAHVAFANYAEFYAYIDSIKASTLGGGASSSGAPDGDILVHSLQASGTMWGSSWGTHATYDSVYNRIVQHGLPSKAVFDQQVTNAAAVLCRRVTIANAASSAIDRNDYLSLSYTSDSVRRHTRLLYWDFALGEAYEMNPYAMTGPTPLIP